MSSSLRERLKRSGRSYKSPATTKCLCQSDIESPPPSCLTPNPSASSPPVCRETPVGSEISPDAAKCISSTMTNAKRSFVETDQASGNIRDKANMSTGKGKQGNAFSEQKYCSDIKSRKLDTTGSLYSKPLSADSCLTPTPKKCHNSCKDIDIVNQHLLVTPYKVNVNAMSDISVTPVKELRDSVDDEGRDTYSTPSRNKHNTCDVDIPCSDGVSSTPVRPCSSDQAGVDTTVESLKKHKTAIQEKIARDEERLRKLKMVKMYRTKVGATTIMRLRYPDGPPTIQSHKFV